MLNGAPVLYEQYVTTRVSLCHIQIDTPLGRMMHEMPELL